MKTKLKKIFFFILLVKFVLLLIFINYPYENVVYSWSKIINAKSSLYFTCEFQLLDSKADKVAYEYLNISANQRMPHYSKCELNDTEKRKELTITYVASENSYLISLDIHALETRIGRTITPQNTSCFIQFFEKKANISQRSKHLLYDKKIELNSSFQIRVNKTGLFYIKCANKKNIENDSLILYHDVFTVFPHHMSQLIENRVKYKTIVENFRIKKLKQKPALSDLIKNVDYAQNCSSEKSEKLSQPNILIFGIDSVSLANFKRMFPATFRFLNEELENNVILDHMNTLGGSTVDNLIPFLTGLSYQELNTKLDKIVDHRFCDYLPLIWNDYEEDGYITTFNEDMPNIGTFNFMRDGFRYFPTHVYGQSYWCQHYKIRSNKRGFCHYKRPSYSYWLEPIEMFVEQMNLVHNINVPYFSFNWFTEYTHDYFAIPPDFDVAIRDLLIKFQSKGYLDNTMLIVMTDHGNKLVSYASTDSGKKERSLPFFSLKLPNNLANSKYHKNLLNNKDKLVTPFDLYKTLNHFLFINNYDLNEADPFCNSLFKTYSLKKRQLRGISLVETIPSNRTCNEALIPVSFCSCFKSVDLSEAQVLNETKHSFRSISAKTLNYIKNITATIRDKCVPYNVTSVSNFKKLFYSYTNIVYSGQIMLQPGDALFQLNFKMSPDLKFYDAPLRLSKYGDQSKCINDRNLKNYCFCIK